MLGEGDGRPWKSKLESDYERPRRQAGVMGFILWPRVDGERHRTLKQKSDSLGDRH